MRRLSSVCALLVGAVLWSTPARADVVVTLNVGHAQPGTVVHVTVTPGCDATAVRLALSGRSAAADESGTTGSQADAVSAAEGGWAADLAVPDDLAAPQDIEVVADVSCPGASPDGSAALHVDPWGTQHLTVLPRDAAVGDVVRYAMTGGHGSCWSAWVSDVDGTTWWLFTSGTPDGPTLHGEVDPGSDLSSRVSGTFEVPEAMALGTATMTLHCSQTADRSTRFDVLPAPPSSGAPAPEGVGASESSAARRPGSGITLGGGLPVVTASPEAYDPRFPLPTLAPPIQPSAWPVLVEALPAASRGSSPSWWWLRGLLVVPVVGIGWGLRRRLAVSSS